MRILDRQTSRPERTRRGGACVRLATWILLVAWIPAACSQNPESRESNQEAPPPRGGTFRMAQDAPGSLDPAFLDDVYEATRAFTGWTIDFDTGTLLYRADRHDRFQKTVLGRMMPADQAPLKDGEDVYDLIAAHPGTGRHIARKLCQRLIADNPPEDVVQEAFLLAFGPLGYQGQGSYQYYGPEISHIT